MASRVTQGAVSDAGFAAALAPFGPFVPAEDPFTTDNNKFGMIERSHVALMSRLDWSTAIGDLTVIPAYRSAEFDELRDIAGIGFNAAGVRGFESTAINDENYAALSIEARMASPGDSGNPLSWIGGFYYLDEKIGPRPNSRAPSQHRLLAALVRPVEQRVKRRPVWGGDLHAG